MQSVGKMIGGILLVSGTTIGAGILALPVSTGLMGYFPAVALCVFYWLFMTFNGLLFLEVNLWMKEDDANIISMAGATLGSWGRSIGWVFYLFLLYALTTAYMSGSGPFFLRVMNWLSGMDFPEWTAPLPLLFLFSFFIYEGAKAVDYANRALMIGLVATYFMTIFYLAPHIDASRFEYVDYSAVTISSSLVATSFGYHIIIPTLTRYLDHNVKQLKTVIILGTLIPLMIYLIWETVTLGALPIYGTGGIYEGYLAGNNIIDLLTRRIDDTGLAFVAQLFLFFAILTSFLGVSISLRDFLSDGLKIKKNRLGKVILYLLTFLPPLIFGWTFKRAFFAALDYAGAYGVITLLAILPALMVWHGRYRKGWRSDQFQAPGGKAALWTVFFFSTVIILIEVGNDIGFFNWRGS